jgi:Ca2+-binding RTX toxin-like protein
MSGIDSLVIWVLGFGGGLVANSTLTNDQLAIDVGVTSATTNLQRFIYNSGTGDLFFDADGSDTYSSAIQVAKLNGNSTLRAGDIILTD